ncbi:cell division protein FtsA [Candidatus Daviesbacteria bacterium]|nr:cell division protein FtsA [Candidatus Daviesbacteria bacterium]
MARDRIVCGIDIGSSKITTVIATVVQDTQAVNVIGVSTIHSKGMRKGQVVNIDEIVSAITENLEAAERMAGCTVSSCYVSIGGSHIASQNSHGVVAVSQPDHEIGEDDVRRVIEAARAISLPSSRETVHVIPRWFVVDGQEGIADPIGMTGIRLEVDTHIISGSTTSMRNLAKAVGEVGVDVDGLVFSGLASAEAVLSDTEKELGVIVVDIGGGTTDICMYVEGALAYSSVLPVGAKNITNDIAIGLRISLDSAEKIKISLSAPPKYAVGIDEEVAIPSHHADDKRRREDEIDLTNLGLQEEIKSASKKTLVDGIIRPRLDQIFEYVGLEIKRSGLVGQTPAGLVLTGGGSQTVGIVESAKKELALPVRIGTPTGLSGLVDEILSPAYATSAGLVVYGARTQHEEKSRNVIPRVGNIQFKGLLSRGMDLLKSLLP